MVKFIVKVYSTPTCPYCKMEKDWLKQNKIEFEDIDVSKDTHAATEIMHRTGQRGVPQTLIKKSESDNGTAIVGFQKDQLKKALGL